MSAEDVATDAVKTAYECADYQIARDVLEALKAAGYAVVELPKPGELSDHHADTEKVWYFGQYGEFTLDSYDNSLHDTAGNAWGADGLREMACAALAAADAAEHPGTPVEASQQETTK